MTMLKDYLDDKGVKVELSATNNPLLCFQKWLKSDQPNKEEKQDFAFLHKVKSSPASSDAMAAALTKRNQAVTIARFLQQLYFERKALEQEKKEVEAERKKTAQALLHAQKKEQKERERKEELARQAPTKLVASGLPEYERPSDEWKRHMMDTFIHIRNMVEDISVTHNVKVPSFVSTAASGSECTSVPEAVKEVGIAAEMFTAGDLSDMATVTAHLQTWLPVPWLESFQSNLKCFHEILTSRQIEGATQRHLATLVGSYMSKKFKPAGAKAAFQSIIDAIRDGEYEFGDSDDEDDAMETEDAIADIEAETDLNDTEHGAAMLNAMRDLDVGTAPES